MQSDSENIMNLQNLISPYKAKGDTGLLSIKVEGNEHLVKIYFNLGMVVGLSIGTLKNEACLNILGKCKPMNATFMKGYKTPDSVATDKAEIDSKLEGLFASYPVTGGTTIAGSDAQTVAVRANDLLKLEADFINIIGPIGKMIVDNVYSEIGYSRGNDMPSPLYSRLIDRLKGELPSQHQPTFAAKFAIGLALGNRNT